MWIRMLVVAGLAPFVVGCASAGARVLTAMPPAPTEPLRVAVSPEAGSRSLADAVGEDLSVRGALVTESLEVAELLHREAITHAASPEGLAALRAHGVDVLLTVHVDWGGRGVKSALVRLLSTESGHVVFAVKWTNGWCAMPDSPCDQRHRKGADYAATQIGPLLEPALVDRGDIRAALGSS
jgi:hypothetical protein